MDCAAALPGAVRFEPVFGKPWVVGHDADGAALGWVVMSTDLVDIKAYSSKPLVTLVGLDDAGVIKGARVVHHNEPILLVGIPESELHDFAAFYKDRPATTRVVVGRGSKGAVSVDVISGATVTALAQNKTILETARKLGSQVGVIDMTTAGRGHFVESEQPLSWAELSAGAFGRLTVTEAEMGVEHPSGAFVDLWFTIADAPQVGRALLGDGDYAYYRRNLAEGDHMLVVFGKGSNSFKGSAFVRGGIFDRIRVEQGLREFTFRDTDYWNLPRPKLAGAPRFKEGALFVLRGGEFDPGAPFDMVFLGSRYDQRGAFTRDFREFKSTFRLPPSIYVVDNPPVNEAMYVQAWRNRQWDALLLGLYLLFVVGVFAARRWTTKRLDVLQALHLSSMIFGFLVVGVYMRAQPSVTQMMTFVDSLVREWRFELFAAEPLIFMLWIFIAVVSIIWGRGVFCGWVCPYGAMTELVNKLGHKLKFPQYELPDRIHEWARYVRYVILAGLIPLYLVEPILAEQLAEIEPFKSTFLVPAWEREAIFLAWWVALLVSSLFVWRPFCRYICPLGGGLALFGSFRRSGPYRRQFCSKCKICDKACEPRAIRKDGTIDPRECLSCMECEATYRNEEKCPPLVGIAKIHAKGEPTDRDRERLARLWTEMEKV
jgi:NosR/NirI family nitrous oxide reductase transcriptional regulator